MQLTRKPHPRIHAANSVSYATFRHRRGPRLNSADRPRRGPRRRHHLARLPPLLVTVSNLRRGVSLFVRESAQEGSPGGIPWQGPQGSPGSRPLHFSFHTSAICEDRGCSNETSPMGESEALARQPFRGCSLPGRAFAFSARRGKKKLPVRVGGKGKRANLRAQGDKASPVSPLFGFPGPRPAPLPPC
jgi:hypothetical protein